MRVFSFYCCCGDFNYKELTLFCIGESVTSIVFLQPINTVIIKKLDKCRILRYIVDGGNVKNLEDESEKT